MQGARNFFSVNLDVCALGELMVSLKTVVDRLFPRLDSSKVLLGPGCYGSPVRFNEGKGGAQVYGVFGEGPAPCVSRFSPLAHSSGSKVHES